MKIDLTDGWSLLAVWEALDQGWQLVSIDRPKRAIALCRGGETERFVFPTHVDPNKVWGKHLKVSKISSEEIKPVSKRELLLELIELFPGQSTTSLAERIGTSGEAVKGYLRTLVRQGKVHCRQSPADGRRKLYYVGQKSSQAETRARATTNTCRTALPKTTRQEPLLKVYFVDPRTLQETIRSQLGSRHSNLASAVNFTPVSNSQQDD